MGAFHICEPQALELRSELLEEAMSLTMQRRSGYRKSGLSVASSSSTKNNADLVSAHTATTYNIASKRPTFRHSNYSLPGDDGNDERHIGDHRFYTSSSSARHRQCTIKNADDNDDIVGDILDSIDFLESQMDPVCDDSSRFSGHVPATGSANQWRHRRGRGRSEPREMLHVQQHPQCEGDITMSQQSQCVSQGGHHQANRSFGATVPLVFGHNEQQMHVLPQHQAQHVGSKKGATMNPYRSKGNALHTIANLMLLFSGFTIALTLLERFCADWLAP